MFGYHSLGNIYLSEIKLDMARYANRPVETIKAADIASLPTPVQRCFRYCGYIGQVKMHNARIELEDCYLKRAPDGNWMRLKGYQYNAVTAPTRMVYLKARMFWVFPFEARDKYQDGKGNMLIKLLNVFTVADTKGVEMDKSGLVTILAETFIVPSYALQPYITWEHIDDNRAKAILKYDGLEVSGVFTFSALGEMLHFYSEDRYFAANDGTYKRVPWSAVVDQYQEENGVRFPSKIKALWHEDSGDFEYFKGRIVHIEYNVDR